MLRAPSAPVLRKSAAVAVLSVFGLTVPAFAATISGDDTSVTVNGGAGNEDIVLTCDGVTVTVTGPDTGGPCALVESIYVDGLDGLDDIDLTGVTAADFPAIRTILVNTAGDEDTTIGGDTVEGSDFAEVFEAEPSDSIDGNGGDDYISRAGGSRVDGGAGDDTIVDSVSDQALGGPGDDVFFDTATEINDGGSGYDVWSARLGVNTTAQNLPVTYNLTFDDDSVTTFVMTPDFTNEASVFLLNFEELELHGVLYVGESYDLSDFPGSASVFSRSGDDTIIGTSKTDRLNAGSGNDTIDSRDGVVDVVNCGPGADTVRADVNDILTGCEDVNLPAPKTSKVKGPSKVKRGTSASFTFSASPSAGVVYQCKLDNTGWKKCTSPYKLGKNKTKKLKVGKHKLSVRAGYPGGPYDSSPAKLKFKIKK